MRDASQSMNVMNMSTGEVNKLITEIPTHPIVHG